MELFFIANEDYIQKNQNKYKTKYIEDENENKIINSILLNMDYIYDIFNENNKKLLFLLPDNPKELSKFYYFFIEDIFDKHNITNAIAKRKYNTFCIIYHKFDFVVLIIHILSLFVSFYYSLYNKKYLFISSIITLSMLIFYFKIFIS